IKDAESLELAKKVNAIILDKTGTITEGRPEVTGIQWFNDDDTHQNILLSIEKQSEHPLAEAVDNYFETFPRLQTLEKLKLSDFDSIIGQRVKASHNDETYYAGNRVLLADQGISIDVKLQQQAEQWSGLSKTIIWLSNSKEALAVLAISDKIKETSVEAIQTLKDMGIELYMLTGDNEATAKAIAEQTGIPHYQAEVLPQQKADF